MEILFTYRKRWNFFAWSISKVMRTKYSHTAIRIWDNDSERYLIYQASVKGIEVITNKTFLRDNVIIHSKKFSIDDKSKKVVVNFCEDYLSTGYGFFTILGLLLKMVFKVYTHIGKDGDQTMICSELVIRAISLVFPALVPYIKDHITPKEVYDLIKSL